VVGVSLNERIKVRFFVPEQEVARYRPGRTVRFSCDSCAAGLTARISFVSPRPEFTPPVIFSIDNREKLVFKLEARAPGGLSLHPGQPVQVKPL